MTKKNAFVLAFSCLLGLAVACSNQGEGERCSSDDDCSANLSCVTSTALSSTTGTNKVCCPPGNTTASAELCRTGGTPNTPDATAEVPDAADVPDAGEEEPDATAEPDASEDPDTGVSPEPDASSDGGSDASDADT